MRSILSRRRLLTGSALVGAAALGACSLSYSGGTAAVSVNVSKINTDADAVIASVENALTAPALVSLLGANSVATINSLLEEVKTSLDNLDKLAGPTGLITLSANVTSAQGFVTTIVSDAQQIVALVKAALPSLTDASLLATIENYLSAILSLLPLIQLAASMAATVTAPQPMSETQAVAVAYNIPAAQAASMIQSGARLRR